MFAAGQLQPNMMAVVVGDLLEELCRARNITDPAIRSYLAAKLAAFWYQGARSRAALMAVIGRPQA